MLKEIDIDPHKGRAGPSAGQGVAGEHVAGGHVVGVHRAGDHAAGTDEGIAALVHRAVDDARELAAAEVALYKAKASERIAAYTSAAIYFGAAAVLALSAVTALLVGLIMALATLIGPLGATAVVVIATLAVAGVLAIIGKGKLAPAKGSKT